MDNFNFLEKRNSEEDQFEEEPAEDLTATLTIKNFYQEDLGLLKYARLLIYILVFLVPLFFLPWTSDILEFNKQFLVFILGAAGLILYLGQAIRTGHLVFKKSLANYAVLIFVAAVLLVSLFSDFRYQSIFGGFGTGFSGSFFSSIGFAILFFLILNVFGINQSPAKEDASKVLSIFGLSLFLTLIFGVLQIFGLPVFKLFGISQNTFNTVGTFNGLGIIAAVLLVFSLARLDLGKNSFWGYFRIPAAVLSLLFLLTLNWWILWLVAIAGLVFILISSSLSDWRISNYFWPSAIILTAVVIMLFNFNLTATLGLKIPIEIAPSFSTSFEITKKVLAKDPLFGVGPENFSLAYDLYKPISINNTIFWDLRFSEATSELFNTLISYGLVGFLAFMFLFFTVSRLGFKNFGLFSIFVTLIAAWVLYPYNMTFGFSLWLLIGLLALSAVKKKDELAVSLEKYPKHSLITSVSFIGVLVLAIIGFYFITTHYAANLKFTRALTNQDIDKKNQLLVGAINLNKSEGIYSRALANLLTSRINQEFQGLSKARTAEERQAIISRVQNFSATAINLSTEMTQRQKEDSANWFSRALVYESLINIIEGSDEWAIRVYQEYARTSPKDPTPYLRTGNIYLIRADFLRQLILGQTAQNLSPENRTILQNQILANLKSAEENYLKATELKPNYVLAIYNLGVVYEREGRVKDAIRQLELTKSANPLDANIGLQLGLLYYRDNQKDRSFNEFQRAITIFSDFSNARWYLALLYEERGRIDNALEELRKIEKLNPDNQVLRNKIEELEKGKRSIPPEKVTGFKPLEEKSRSQ